MPSFHFLRYHNFSNNRSGCLVLQDVANSLDAPTTWENASRRMGRFRCAYIQLPNQSDLGEDEDCVVTIGGMLTIRWHGTWHRRVDPVLRSGSLSLYVEFAYNGINRYGRKTDTLWPLRMSQPNHVLLHRMELTLVGQDYNHRQCAAGLHCHMFGATSDLDIVRTARTVVLPEFLRQIATIPASIVSELAQDPLAHDNMLIDQALALEVVPPAVEDGDGSWHIPDAQDALAQEVVPPADKDDNGSWHIEDI